MANILISERQVWTRQPPRVVEVDPRAVHCIVGNAFYDYATNSFPITNNLIAQIPTENGLALLRDDANKYIEFPLSKKEVSTEYTLIFYGQLPTTSVGAAWGIGTASSYGILGAYTTGSSQLAGYTYNTSGTSINAVITTNLAGKTGVFISRWKSGETMTVWSLVNGLVYKATSASSLTGSVRTTTSVFRTNPLANNVQGIHKTNLVVLLNSKITDAEVAELLDNPWQLIKKNKRTIFIPSSSSGTEYTITPSGSITFSGTSSSSKTKVIPTSGLVTFNGTAPLQKIGGSVTYTILPSGTVTFNGTSVANRTRMILPSGLITFSGNNTIRKDKVIIPTGQITYSGNNTFIKTKVIAPSGNITFLGSAPLIGPGGDTGANTTKLPLTGAGKT